MVELAPDGGGFINQVKDAPKGTYSINNEIIITLPKDGLLVLSKTRSLVEKANDVIAGKADSLRANQAFSDFATVPNAFIFLAVAEGFSAKANLPPQAQILQQADGGRLVLGEKADNLYLSLALRAKTAEVSQQLQQVVQGMIALVSMSQQQQPDLVQLMQNLKVTSTDKLVSLAIEYPVAKVIEKLGAVAAKEKVHGNKAPEKKPAAEHEEAETAPAK